MNPGQRPACLLIALVSLATWAASLGGGFVYDDLANLVQNPWIRTPEGVIQAFTHHAAAFDPQFQTSYFRPLMHLFYALTHALFGLRPWAFHLVNLIFHTACCLLAFRLAGRLFERAGLAPPIASFAALAAALLFAVHPVHAEAVAWIAGITDLSATFFLVLALLFSLRAQSTLSWTDAAAAGAFFLATLCKEPAFVLPGLVLGVELILPGQGKPVSPGRLAARLLPLLIAAAAGLALRFHAIAGLAPALRPTHLGGEGAIGSGLWLLVQYSGMLVAPLGLNALHPFTAVPSLADPRALAGLLAVAAISGMAFALRRHRIVPLGIVFLFLPLLPALYIPALGEGVLAERYLYFPVFGFGLLAAFGLARFPRRAVRWSVLGAVIVVFGGLSIARTSVWRSNLTLWTDAVAKTPHSAAAHEYLCYALLEAQRPAEAETRCREALRLDPSRDNAVVNLAAALAAQAKLAEAQAFYQQALARRPGSPEALTGQGLVQMAQGNPEAAIASYRAALASSPAYAEAHNCLGVALIRTGRLDEGIFHLERAVREAPANPEYQANLNAARGMSNRPPPFGK